MMEPQLGFVSGTKASPMCTNYRTCRNRRMKRRRLFRLEIDNLGRKEWGLEAEEVLTAFPAHIISMVLGQLRVTEKLVGILNLLRLCGQAKKTDQR